METAVFVGYRGGLHTQRNKQILLTIEHVDTRDTAAQYIGRNVLWRSPTGAMLRGKISGVHGRRGVMRARFKKGLPGYAVGTEIEVH